MNKNNSELNTITQSSSPYVFQTGHMAASRAIILTAQLAPKHPRFSPAFMATANGNKKKPDSGFATNSNALLAGLNSVDGLIVTDWARNNEFRIDGKYIGIEEQMWEITYRGKHIMVSFVREETETGIPDYHLLSNVVGEGYTHRCRCVNVWVRWFNGQFKLIMVTPVSHVQ